MDKVMCVSLVVPVEDCVESRVAAKVGQAFKEAICLHPMFDTQAMADPELERWKPHEGQVKLTVHMIHPIPKRWNKKATQFAGEDGCPNIKQRPKRRKNVIPDSYTLGGIVREVLLGVAWLHKAQVWSGIEEATYGEPAGLHLDIYFEPDMVAILTQTPSDTKSGKKRKPYRSRKRKRKNKAKRTAKREAKKPA